MKTKINQVEKRADGGVYIAMTTVTLEYGRYIQRFHQEIGKIERDETKDLIDLFGDSPEYVVAKSHIREIKVAALSAEEYDIPTYYINQLNEILSKFAGAFSKLRKNAESGPGDMQLKDSSKKMLGEVNDSADLNVPRIVAYIASRASMRAMEAAKVSEQTDMKLSRAAKLLEDVQKLLGPATADNSAHYFNAEARRHGGFNMFPGAGEVRSWGGASTSWFIAGALVLIVGAVFFWQVFSTEHQRVTRLISSISSDQNVSTAAKTRAGSSKITSPRVGRQTSMWALVSIYTLSQGLRIAFFAVWLFVLRFCFRQYSRSKQEFIMNRHRANILSSVSVLMDSVGGDKELHSAILLEATRAIFAAPGEQAATVSDRTDTASIAEIVKAATQKP